MSIRHHHIVTSSAAISSSISSSVHHQNQKEEEYDKLSKMQSSTSSSSLLATIFGSNICLYLALITIFVVWLLMMAKSLNIDLQEFTHSALLLDTIASSTGSLEDLEDLPSYVLDKRSYYDMLPGYMNGIVSGTSGSSSSGGNSVLPDYYLRDEDLVTHYPRYYPLIDLLTAWPAKDVSKSQWKKSMAHPLYGKKNEERYYSDSNNNNRERKNIHRFDPNSPSQSLSQKRDGDGEREGEREPLTTDQMKWIQQIPNGLYRLNYRNETELALAFKLRDKEVPYVLYNIPELDEAARSDFSADVLQTHFGSIPRLVEKSEDNEFMYYTVKDTTASSIVGQRFPDWKPPQQDVLMSFRTFLREAITAEIKNNVAISHSDSFSIGAKEKEKEKEREKEREKRGKYKEKDIVDIVGERPLHYLVISGSEGSRTKWIRHALPMFEPKDSLFMREPEQYRGVNCRFGMKGIIAAAHYDSRTNYIAMVRGRKRYVLQPPSECSKLELLPRGHPSARHSAVVWSNLTDVQQFPHLMNSKATEVVLSMGEMLYLPSYWFHYIISQDASIQCNARSGESIEGKEFIDKCGFSRRFGGKKSIDSTTSTNSEEGSEIDDVQEQVDRKAKLFESEGLGLEGGESERERERDESLVHQRQKRMRRNKGGGANSNTIKAKKKKKRQGVDWNTAQ